MLIFLLLPKLKYSNKKIIFTQKNNFQMKKLLSKLFSYLHIMNSVMLSSYRNLKRGNKNAWEFVFYSGCLLGVVMFFIIVELSKQLLLKFL